MSTEPTAAARYVRVCRIHKLRLQEQGDKQRCPHGGGHVVNAWDIVDRDKGSVIAAADKDGGGDFLPGKGRPVHEQAKRDTKPAKAPKTEREKRTLRTVKFQDGKGAWMYLRLEKARSVPFVVRWQIVDGDSSTGGAAALCQTEDAAGRAYDAQLEIARARGWTVVEQQGGRNLKVAEIPWARPPVAAASPDVVPESEPKAEPDSAPLPLRGKKRESA